MSCFSFKCVTSFKKLYLHFVYVNCLQTITLLTDISILHIVVLHCGDFPIVANGRNSSTDATPWLPGSKVTYSCDTGYMLKTDGLSTIECVINGEKKTAEWSDSTNIICSAGM